MSLEISEAQLLAFFLESVFWGIQLVTYISCMHTIFVDETHAKRNFITIVSTVFLLMATLNEALIVYTSLDAFIYYDGIGGAQARFPVTLGLTTLLGDGVLVWRCWELHQRRWLSIAFPAVLWVTCIALGFAGIGIQLTTSNVIAISPGIRAVITSYWVCTFVLNLTTTSLIILCLWKAEQSARQVGLHRSDDSLRGTKHSPEGSRSRSVIMNAIYTMSESGLLFTLTIFVALVTHITLPTALYPTSCVLIQVAGIAFNLIIIRTAQRTRQAHPTEPTLRSIALRNLNSTDGGGEFINDHDRSFSSRTTTSPKACNDVC